MNTTWHTKWGSRRVRKDPPTIEEALIAAESMTDDLAQRVEIAASLIGASVDEVKALAAKQAHLSRGRSTLVAGRNRARGRIQATAYNSPARRGAALIRPPSQILLRSRQYRPCAKVGAGRPQRIRLSLSRRPG
jgi:hypothetical protein